MSEEMAAPRVGIEALQAVVLDLLQAVVLDLEDWSKELSCIAGFEGLAAQVIKSAGQIRAAIETVRIKVETLQMVCESLGLPKDSFCQDILLKLGELKVTGRQTQSSIGGTAHGS